MFVGAFNFGCLSGTAGWQRTLLIADKSLMENSGFCGPDFIWISELLEGPDINLRRVLLLEQPAMYFGVAWLECFASTISPNGSTPSTCTQLSCRIKGSDTSPVCQDYFSHPLLCLGPHLASSCFCRPLCPSLKCLKSWPCCQVTPSSCVIEEILK